MTLAILSTVLFAGSFAVTEYLLNHSKPVLVDLGKVPPGAPAHVAGLPRSIKNSVSSPAGKVTASLEPGLVGTHSWLVRLNHYRSLAGLQAVREDADWSSAAAGHARYIVKSYAARMKAGYSPSLNEVHDENTESPFYNRLSAEAARSGDEAFEWFRFEPGWMIDQWMTTPFHRPGLLMPGLIHVGYGQYCEDGGCAACITMTAPSSERQKAIEFPPGGSTTELRSFDSTEVPNPLSNCRGYAFPVGLPITLQLGGARLVGGGPRPKVLASAEAWSPKLSAYSVTKDGLPLQACGFTDGESVPLVVVIPREPLVIATYNVRITANDQLYEWQFTVR